MKTFGNSLLWIIVVALGVSPVAYFLLRITVLPISRIAQLPQDQIFLDSAMGNWFATMVGLVAGVPIGLWINRKQQEEQERSQQREQAKHSKERKIKILNLTRSELIFNRDILADLINTQGQQPGTIYVTGLKDVLWNTLSDGGELQWIDDLDLLNKLADAYYHVRALIFLEKLYFDPHFHSAVTRDGRNTYAGERVVQNVMNIRPGVLSAVENTINAIDTHLASL